MKKKSGSMESLRHVLHKDKLLVNIFLWDAPEWACEYDKYHTTEEYVNVPESEILTKGYKQAINYKSGWQFMSTKVYIQFHGLSKYKIGTDEEDCLDTSATLSDYLDSDAVEKFQAGMSKISLAPIEKKKLITIAIIGIGVLVGFLMVFQ